MGETFVYYEGRLKLMLQVADIPVSPCYRPEQVQRILNISKNTFVNVCDKWQPALDGGLAMGLESYCLGTHRRVPHHALVEWLQRNNGYDRQSGGE